MSLFSQSYSDIQSLKTPVYISEFVFLFPIRCHGARPPPNPEFTVKPKKKKYSRASGSTPGSECPPCPELVWRSCVGQHEGAERMVSFSWNVRTHLYAC